MEIFPYIFSVLITAWVIHWSRVMAARKPGTPLSGLFRYRESIARPAPRKAKFASVATATVRR